MLIERRPIAATSSDSMMVSPIWLGLENSQSSLTIGKPTRRCAIIVRVVDVQALR